MGQICELLKSNYAHHTLHTIKVWEHQKKPSGTIQNKNLKGNTLYCKNIFSVRWCSNGVISSLERFFSWYGELVASSPWTSILICLAITVGGGLGLLR